MKILLCTDKPEAKELTEMITCADVGAEVCFCASADDLPGKVSSGNISVVITDIVFMDAARELMREHPYLNVIFVSSDRRPAADAFTINASGFLLRPVRADLLVNALKNLRYSTERKHRVRFQCFGNFDVFADERSVHFKYSKTREMLAFLVSRNGSLCTNGQIMAALWEDESPEAYLRKLKKDLKDTFTALKCEDIITMQRGAIGIRMDKVISDYHGASTLHRGVDDFMMQYSWAEEINAAINML